MTFADQVMRDIAEMVTTVYRLQSRHPRLHKRWCHVPYYFATKLEAERWLSDYRLEYPTSAMKWRIKEERGFVTHVYPTVRPERIKP
jgi:hypothetical protein